MAQTERRLSAIMLADIVGYSTLMERKESRTFARLQSLREQVVNPKVAEFGGRVIKTTGDGFLAEFPSPTAALGCGITIQRTNFAQESTRDEAERFHLRIGINLGDIVIDGDDVSGDVDGGLNPRLSGAALKTGTNFAANSWRPECGAMDPCQRRKPPEAVAKGQR